MLHIQLADNIENELKWHKAFNVDPVVVTRCDMIVLKANGVDTKTICKITGKSERTVRSVFRLFLDGGIDAMTTRNHYRPTCELDKHRDTILESLTTRPVGSAKEAVARIKQLTGVTRSETRVKVFMKKIGLKCIKTGQIPAKANIEEQEEFLKKKLKPAVNKALKGDGHLYFLDAAHFVWGTAYLMCVWCLKRIFIRTSSGRKRRNVLGAWNVRTRKLETVINETYINSQSIVEMLRKLRRKHRKGKITIVLDNAAYQRCDFVKQEAKRLKITLLFLPPYSPNLNLIERLWKFLKKRCLNNCYYETFDLFKQGIDSSISRIESEYQIGLSTLMTPKFQSFKTCNL